MRIPLLKKLLPSILLIICMLTVISMPLKGEETKEQEQEKPAPVKVEDDEALKLSLSLRDGICKSRSPIMINVLFVNESRETQRICTFKFYDALLSLDIKDASGKKIEFVPRVIKLENQESISDKDWMLIPPGRTFKKRFSLTRKVIDATGYRLKPGSYTVKATYEGCAKFDPDLPSLNLESNTIHLLVTE